jgi:hypothetical protein
MNIQNISNGLLPAQLFYCDKHNNTYDYRHQIVDIKDALPHDFTFKISTLCNYKFQRRSCDLNDATARALNKLRKKYNKIRLWYSGGQDSHFLLHHFLSNKIHIDEIYTLIKTPCKNPLSLALDEGLNAAKPFLESIADQLSSTKICYPRATHQELDRFYSENPDYWRYNMTALPNPWHTSNKISHWGLDQEGVCNLAGIETPHVYWDGAWKFCFIDVQILEQHTNKKKTPVCNISLDDPEWIESYVNAIVDQMELYPDFQIRFSWEQQIKKSTKIFQSMVPELQYISGNISRLRTPKVVDANPPADASFVEKLLLRNFRAYEYLQSMKIENEHPWWLDQWRNNTDWGWIEKGFKFGGVASDHWVLND